ncbi:MAG: hypothetical protein ABMA15_11520 [Vicinamibacterales bacterium]
MGQVSQAFKRSGVVPTTPREGDASASSDSIFNAFAPEASDQAGRPDAPRLVTRPVGRSAILTAVPSSAPSATNVLPPWSSANAGAATPAAAPTTDAPVSTAAPDSDSDRLIDPQQIGNYLGFIARAVGRRWLLSGTTALLMLSATTAAALFWPKAYNVDAKLLVQRNDVMASLVNPGRTIAREAESPTRAAEEVVLQHENLLAVIKQTDLLNEWERTRVPLLKTKDRILENLRGPKTDEDKLDAMVGLLQQRLKIAATPEGSVTFDLRWPDPKVAYEIVDHAIQNFLQFRRVSETSAITDSIAILDQSVKTLEAQVTQTISELPKRRTSQAVRSADAAPATAVPAAPVVAAPAGPPADVVRRLARMKADLDSRRQDIVRLEEAHRLQLSDAQSRLAAAKMVYAENFPTVIALRQSVAQLSRESPELTALRRETQSLESDYETLSAAIHPDDPTGLSAASLATVATLAPRARIESTPIELDLASITGGDLNDPTSLRLKVELAELATVRERANAARNELSSSQAGFKYQYTVIRPPQIPREPASPNVPLFLVAGVLASVLLAAMAAVAADLSSGRVLEPWQVERQLGVPVAVTLRENTAKA